MRIFFAKPISLPDTAIPPINLIRNIQISRMSPIPHDDPQKYKIEPLAWFFVKILRSSLSDIEVYRNRYAQLQKLSESGLAVLNCFKSSPEKRLKVSDIEKDTSLPRRTVQYALQTLTKKAFTQKLGQGAGTRYQLIF